MLCASDMDVYFICFVCVECVLLVFDNVVSLLNNDPTYIILTSFIVSARSVKGQYYITMQV